LGAAVFGILILLGVIQDLQLDSFY